MSEENVELALRAYDTFNRRDLDAFLELMADDVHAESRLAAVEGGYHGHEGVRRWWRNLLEIFPDYATEAEDVRDLGGVTLTCLLTRAHGVASDTPLVERLWQPIRWRDGKCVWWTICSTEAEALEAAGLSE